MLFSDGLWAQNLLEKRISATISAGSAEAAIRLIEVACKCKFSYNPSLLPPQIESKTFENQPLDAVIKQLLGDHFNPKSRGSYIILNAEETKQEKANLEISGLIVDAATGEKLTNVTVYDVQNLTATLSDAEGKYDLSTSSETRELVVAISKKNYQDTVIRISDLAKPDFSLSLRPITRPSEEIQKESTGVFKEWSSRVFKEHDRNVQLYEERFFQLAFVPGVGTNGLLGGKITNNLSLNLIAGNANGVKGAELSGVLGRVKTDAIGFQTAGVSNIVGENLKGAQIAGVSNTVILRSSGFQTAGVVNTAKEMTGVQIGGVQNTVFEQVNGVQVAGVVNYAGAVKGTQISGVWNHTSGITQGLQLSGFFNYTGTLRGLQIGVVNVSGKVEKGFAFGLFNFVKDGFHELEIGTNDIADIQFSFKSGVPGFYSILNAGISPQTNGLWTYGLGMGSQVVQGKRLTLDLATSYNAVQPLTTYIVDTPTNTQFDVLFGFKFTERISVNAGPILHWLYYNRGPQDPSEFLAPLAQKLLFHKGKNNPENTSILWIGYQANIRF